MIQLAWLWLRHQPQSALALWFRERIKRKGGRLRQDDDRGAGAQAAGRALEVCDRWRSDRGSRHQGRLTINADRILAIFQDLISPGGSRWTNRTCPWPEKPS